MLHEILHREEYKNVTGLAEVLNVYLEEQYDILDEEDIKLKQEEDEVAYERKRLVDYVGISKPYFSLFNLRSHSLSITDTKDIIAFYDTEATWLSSL